jgi:hypothetical protein
MLIALLFGKHLMSAVSRHVPVPEIYSGGGVEIKRELLKLYLMQMSLVLVEPSLVMSQYASDVCRFQTCSCLKSYTC